jgi:unsaturated chondroitin disaccharide hydrolase
MTGMNAFPLWTDGEAWVTAPFDHGDRGILPHDGSWMAGDLPSIAWFVAEDAEEAADHTNRGEAARWSGRLANRTGITSFASVSHMFFRGAFLPLHTHGAEDLRAMLMEAAATISARFLRVGYMKSFGEPGDPRYPFTTIDDVINLCIPFWYANETGDERLAAAVREAAALVAERLVRDDGSTSQVLHFDEQGRPTTTGTYQGFSPSGCWSRGLAWGIYGYALLYALSHDALHLQLADAMADYWIDRVQDDPSPVWDFALPAGHEKVRDSFAASLAHAGLLELAAWSKGARADTLRDYTRTMATSLSAGYVVDHKGLGILRGAALDVPHNHGVGDECAVIVGDSYFTETLWRLRNRSGDESVLQPARPHGEAIDDTAEIRG